MIQKVILKTFCTYSTYLLYFLTMYKSCAIDVKPRSLRCVTTAVFGSGSASICRIGTNSKQMKKLRKFNILSKILKTYDTFDTDEKDKTLHGKVAILGLNA
jgi:hypothetical protein